jgi:hypothetical protein
MRKTQQVTLDIRNLSMDSINRLKAKSRTNPYFDIYPKEHYCLLTNISDQLPDGTKVADIGTYDGMSALALSSNPKVKVITIDVTSDSLIIENIPNITYLLGSWEKYISQILKCEVVFFDTDHLGVQEHAFHNELVKNNYSGYAIYDDIHLNPFMEEFWNSIEQDKIDATHIGHWSGTGIVLFNRKLVG